MSFYEYHRHIDNPVELGWRELNKKIEDEQNCPSTQGTLQWINLIKRSPYHDLFNTLVKIQSDPACLINKDDPLTKSIRDSLCQILEEQLRLLLQHTREFHSNATTNNWTVYSGLGGVAYVLLKLYLCHKHAPSFQFLFSKEFLLGEAKSYLDRAVSLLHSTAARRRHERQLGFLCTPVGIYSLSAVIYSHLGGDNKSSASTRHDWRQDVQRALQLGEEYLHDNDGDFLYGLSGYLYGLRFMKKYIHWDDDIDLGIEAMIRKVMSYLLQHHYYSLRVPQGLSMGGALKEKIYLGAAHGVIGTLASLLKSDLCLEEGVLNESRGRELNSVIEELVDLTNNDKDTKEMTLNLPSSIPFQRHSHDHTKLKRELCHWCHGTPSLILLLQEVSKWNDCRFPSLERDFNFESHINVLRSMGFLTKGAGLCHGLSGNGFILLSHYLHQLHKLALASQPCDLTSTLRKELGSLLLDAYSFAITGVIWKEASSIGLFRLPDSPYSLMEGQAGYIMFLNALIMANHFVEVSGNLSHFSITELLDFPAFVDA